MKILGIETSCDETAVSIVEAEGSFEKPRFTVLGDALYSQVKSHAEHGGVVPTLAKREHAKNLGPLLTKALREAKLFHNKIELLSPELSAKLEKILEREEGLFEATKDILESIEKPSIHAIAVTQGPGLEPALWVGISFARALGVAWGIPVIPTNHMEGHIVSPLLSEHPLPPLASKKGDSSERESRGVQFPALALLISGGHTELVLVKNWLDYKIIGSTRDDAIGEAFDKVARLLELPYPGGPEISKLAEEARMAHTTPSVKLPRPMLRTHDYDFSFSGIKTAVLYSLKKYHPVLEDSATPPKLGGGQGEVLSYEVKREYALEFENAVTEVLVGKTKKAIEDFGIKTLILGGGVIANTHIRKSFQKFIAEEYSDTKLLIPDIKDSTDNAVMIAAASYLNILAGSGNAEDIKAEGNLSLSK